MVLIKPPSTLLLAAIVAALPLASCFTPPGLHGRPHVQRVSFDQQRPSTAISATSGHDSGRHATVRIEYCPGCRWMLKSFWYAQEILTTFNDQAGLDAVILVPSRGDKSGKFKVEMFTNSEGTKVLWDRQVEDDGGFPSTKDLKQKIRDFVSPSKFLGHSDTKARQAGASVGYTGRSVGGVAGGGLEESNGNYETTSLEDMVQLPCVSVTYCAGCRWLLRAAYLGQELLTSFDKELGTVLLLPSRPPDKGGRFTLHYTADKNTGPAILFDREQEGRFPEAKEVKQALREKIAPTKNLGHTDAAMQKKKNTHDPGPPPLYSVPRPPSGQVEPPSQPRQPIASKSNPGPPPPLYSVQTKPPSGQTEPAQPRQPIASRSNPGPPPVASLQADVAFGQGQAAKPQRKVVGNVGPGASPPPANISLGADQSLKPRQPVERANARNDLGPASIQANVPLGPNQVVASPRSFANNPNARPLPTNVGLSADQSLKSRQPAERANDRSYPGSPAPTSLQADVALGPDQPVEPRRRFVGHANNPREPPIQPNVGLSADQSLQSRKPVRAETVERSNMGTTPPISLQPDGVSEPRNQRYEPQSGGRGAIFGDTDPETPQDDGGNDFLDPDTAFEQRKHFGVA